MGQEATALKKNACPSCGAEATWNPARQALVCRYCGTVAPGRLEPKPEGGTQIVEHDLVAALRAIPDSSRGFPAEKVSVRCQTCRAISVFDAARVGQRCDFCGASALVPYEEIKESFRPESLLPLQVSESRARELIRDWYGRVWFAPSALRRKALTDTVKGVYLPYWTFDARVMAAWTAESGTYYYTEEEVRLNNGQIERRRVQHTRWQPASGSLDHFFDDDLVTASRGVPERLLRKVEPFPTADLLPYDAGYLAGWVVERYQIDLVTAAQRSRDRMQSAIEAMCASEVPGDTHRNLRVDASFTAQTFKHILAPVWLLQYNFNASSYQVVINGVTGNIGGEHPLSWGKIALAVLAGVAVVLGLLALTGGR